MNDLHQGAQMTFLLRKLHSLAPALLFALLLTALVAPGAHAQSPTPVTSGGICAPSLLPLSGSEARAVNSDPALNESGTRATFWSTANPAGMNPDGSIELFSGETSLNAQTGLVDASVAQLTESRGNILGGFNIMPDVASALIGGQVTSFSVFASDRDLAPMGATNNGDGGFEIFLARRAGAGTQIYQVTNTRRAASILPSISNPYPEGSPRYVNIAFVSDADDTATFPKGQAGNGNYEVYVMKLDLASWPPKPVGGVLQVTQTPNNVTNDKPVIARSGNAIVFLSDATGLLNPGTTTIAVNGDENREVYRVTFTKPESGGVVTFRQVTNTGSNIDNDSPDCSADGTQVVFMSTEQSPANATVNVGSPVVYVSSLAAATPTYTALSASLKANPAHLTTAKDPAINGRGDRIVFAADGCDPQANPCAQPAGQFQVFVADQDIASKQFVVAQVTSLTTTTHESPAISGDGRFIALVTSEGSAASNPDLSGSEVAILFCPVASLEPIKTFSIISDALNPERPDVGDTVDYVISLSNGSLTSFEGTMRFTDVLPPQFAYNGVYSIDAPPAGTTVSPVTWNAATRTVTWTVSRLPNRQLATVRLRGTILAQVANVPVGGQTVANQVNITTTTPISSIQSGLVKIVNEATVEMGITRVDLSGSATLSTQTPREQVPFTVTLVVTNTAAGTAGALDPATNVRMTTTLPSLVGFQIVTGANVSGTYEAISGLWTVPLIPAGQRAVMKLTVTPQPGTGGTALRTFRFGAPVSDQQDNNAANAIVGGNSRSLRVLGTDLALVSKTVNKQGPPQNSDVTYTIVVRNNGPTAPLTDTVYLNNVTAFVPNTVVVRDTLDPTKLEFVSATLGGVLEGNDVVWRVPGWAAGTDKEFKFTAKVRAAPGTTVTNRVSSVQGLFDSIAGPPMADPLPANNAPEAISATITTNQPAAVSLQIRPQPGRIDEGQQVTLTVRYSDPDVLDSHVVAVNWGDGQPTESWQGPVNASVTVEHNFFHRYADDNADDRFIITATVTDNNGQANSAAAPVIVNNVLPTSTGLAVTQSTAVSGTAYIVRVGETLAVRQTFSDPGFTRAPLAETFSYIPDWGDGPLGTATPVTSVTNGSPGVPTTGTIPASHVYVTPGTYSVGFRVSDDDQSATGRIATVQVIVAEQIVAANYAFTINEDQFVAQNVLANSAGDTIQLVSVSTQPITGTAVPNLATGVVTFTAATRFDALQAGQQRVDGYNYTIRDRFAFTAIGRVNVTVTGVNDPPALDLNGGAPGVTTTVAFKEDFGNPIVAPALIVADPDDTNMLSATVQIQNLQVPDTEQLFVGAPGALSVAYDATSGRLVLAGSATKAAYQSALASVAYTNTSQNPNTTPRTLLFQVRDAQGADSQAVAATVTVERTDDPPVVTTSEGPTLAVEDSTPYPIDPAITVTDLDSPMFTGGAFTATVQSAEKNDVLSIEDGGFITVVGGDVRYNGVSLGTLFKPQDYTIVVTLNDGATEAAVQAVARRVAYTRQKGKKPASTTKVVEFTVRSSATGAPSNTATKTISLTPVNDAPEIAFLSFPTVLEETPTDIRAGFAVTDVDTTGTMSMTVTVANGSLVYAGSASIIVNNGPSITVNGTAVQLQGGTLTYTGNADFSTTETITVAVNDNDPVAPGLSDTKTTTFPVTNSNDAPRLKLTATTTDTSAAYTEDGAPVQLAPAAAVSDIDIPPNLTSATVRITNLLNTGQETLNATGGILSVIYNGGTGQLTLTGNASPSTYLAALQSVTYANTSNTPNLTPRLIDFQLFDSGPVNSAGNTARATVSVAAHNDAPTLALAVVPNVDQTTPLSVGGLVTIGDVDAIGSETATFTATVGSFATLTVSPANPSGLSVSGSGTRQVLVTGSLVNITGWLAAPNALVYQAVTGFIGGDSLTVNYRDGASVTPGSLAAPPASRNFLVQAVNDAPTVTIGAISVIQNVATDIHPAIVVDDVDSPSSTMRMTATVQSGTLSYSGSTPAGSGSGTARLVLVGTLAQLNAAYAINYLSPFGAFGTQAITVTVNDGDSATPGPQTGSSTGTISINAPPVVDLNGNNSLTGFSTTYTEQAAAKAIVGTSGGNGLTVSDVDSASILSATVQIVGPLDAGGETLSATASGLVAVNYNATSGRLTLTGNATKDAYRDVLRTVKYASASETPSASRTINFQIFDNGTPPLGSAIAVATVTVAAVNDPPTLALAAVPNVNEDTSLSVGGLITIGDVDALTTENATFTAEVLHGALTVAGATDLGVTGSGTAQVVVVGSLANMNAWKATTSALVYQGVSNYNGPETLTINYRDGSAIAPANLAAPQRSAGFTVNAVNDAPTLALAAVAAVNEDTPLSVGALVTIGDVDAAPTQNATFTAAVLHGTLTVAGATDLGVTGSGTEQVVVVGSLANINAWKVGANALVYQGILNYNGDETLTVNYRDGSAIAPADLTAVPRSSTFTVNAVNDAPVLSTNTGLVTTQVVSPTVNVAPIVTSAMLAATDVDSAASAIVFTMIAQPGVGTLRLSGAPLAACATFTQEQLTGGLVTYAFSSASVPIGTSFAFNVANAANCTVPGTAFTISVTAP